MIAVMVPFAVSADVVRMPDAAFARKFATAPTIDGVISETEWGKPTRTVKDDGTLPSVFSMRTDEAGALTADKANPDQSYDIWLRWDKDYFYMAVKTADKTHFNKNTASESIWDGDALQMDFNACNMCFGLGNDGKVGKYLWSGKFDNSKLDIKNDGSFTSYEIAFAWKDIFSGDALAGTKLNLTTVVLTATEDKGTESSYDGWLTWGDGCCGPQEASCKVGYNKIILSDTDAKDAAADPAVKTYTVKFQDADGNDLSSQLVYEGDDAVAPTNPTKEGYKFTSWDASYSNIKADTTVKAQFAKLCIVTFADYDGTEIKKVDVETGKAATAPKDPTREGYTFTGWDKDFSAVTEDITVTAQYEEAAVTPATGETSTATGTATATGAPATGETPAEENPSNVWIYVVIAVVVIAAGAAIIIFSKKKKA
ncbi:hypothetical protein SDC9_118407 [bioreactor metagenome]|uniref:Carbohydrate-binding domain-containing protein n=1 Tax=bioreactor metagenome TaxID=1076179 RepID=A0A645C1F0_9ZZZZ